MNRAGFLGILSLLLIIAGCQSAHSVTKLNFDRFIGERITLLPHAQNIESVQLDLHLPENHHLLPAEGSYIRLVNSDGMPITKLKISRLDERFNLNFVSFSDVVYAELALFYCRSTEEGLCLIQKILYKIPLVKNADRKKLEIQYTVPGFK